MNLEHKEKKLIFDEYSRSQGFESWEQLDGRCDYNTYLNHLFNACDLIQRKVLVKASENAITKEKQDPYFQGYGECRTFTVVDKESITNENNLIK